MSKRIWHDHDYEHALSAAMPHLLRYLDLLNEMRAGGIVAIGGIVAHAEIGNVEQQIALHRRLLGVSDEAEKKEG